MNAIKQEIDIQQIKLTFEYCFYRSHKTQLLFGYPEPFYLAKNAKGESEIQCRGNNIRSALHEIAHWCVAGAERRLQDDLDYWYKTDGRTREEQQLFYKVEILPQAYEKIFCKSLQLPFEVSADNLDNPDPEGTRLFSKNVDLKFTELETTPLPKRVALFSQALASL